MANPEPEGREQFSGRVDAKGFVGRFQRVIARIAPQPKQVEGIPQDRNTLIPPLEAVERGLNKLVGAKVDAYGMHGGTWVKGSK